MRYLLDTSTLLWFLLGDRKLNAINRSRIGSPDNDVFVSLASMWELAIKFNAGKLSTPLSFTDINREIGSRQSFRFLEINIGHLESYIDLPRIHRDPFDRLLIAQSLAEDLPIISSDNISDQYPIARLW
ncbi:MAG: type II toxin-antitoxin system VapC family toxin [Chloroflexi bacterium]|nr:type II toxin-antitoxin system VapC family toxin [Chloroflexota bacterium]